MSHVIHLKESILKDTQEYYTCNSKEDKEKYKINLQKKFKQFHHYRETHKTDYKSIKKIIENIT